MLPSVYIQHHGRAVCKLPICGPTEVVCTTGEPFHISCSECRPRLGAFSPRS